MKRPIYKLAYIDKKTTCQHAIECKDAIHAEQILRGLVHSGYEVSIKEEFIEVIPENIGIHDTQIGAVGLSAPMTIPSNPSCY